MCRYRTVTIASFMASSFCASFELIIMMKVHCEGCGEDSPSYEITHYGSMDGIYRQFCSCCFSAEVAKVSGIDNFDNTRLQPIRINDCAGEAHQFHFVSRLLGN